MSRQLLFEGLESRHQIDPHQLRCYANAARVRLDAHHKPPVDFDVASLSGKLTCLVGWSPTNDTLRRSTNNSDYATRDGAYVLAFAAVEELEGLISIGRAETKTGADYYLAPAISTHEDFESAVRLEVSGTDGTPPEVKRRLKMKQAQARSGLGNGPAIAAVVGFKSRLILIDRA